MSDRRSFLRGLFGGITSAGLIIAAKPKEIEAFTAPLLPKQDLILAPPIATPEMEIGEYLYNARGEQVALVTAINYEPTFVDATSFYGSSRHFHPGAIDFRIEARGLGSLDFVGSNGWPRLRGRRR